MTDATSEIQISPLSGPVSQDDVTIHVEIYRLPDREGWTLEVLDQDAGTTVWETTFETDEKAYQIFKLALELEGIQSFAEAPKSKFLRSRSHS